MPQLDPIIRIAWSLSVMQDRAQPFDQNLRERIISFEFTDKAQGADKAKLILLNHDLALNDMEALKPENRLYVQWGYAHSMYSTRTVTIEKIKGFRKLTIEGTVTEARQFIGSQKTRTWENATEFEIAEEIAHELGFREGRTKVIEQGDVVVERKGFTQAGETDMAFLLRIAREIGCTFYTSGGVFHFHERRLDREPLLTFTYFSDREGYIIGDPEIEHNIQGRPGAVRRSGRSTREREDVIGEASNRQDTNRPVLGQELPCSDPEGVDWESIENELGINLPQSIMPPAEEAQSDVAPTAAESDSQATSEARQRFRSSERQSVKLNLTLVGNAEVRADNTIRIEGIGEKYSGNYYIEEAIHTVSNNGYRTKVKMKRNATSRSRGTGATRRRVEQQATASAPAGSDLPYSSEFNVWDCQGNLNVAEPPTTDVNQVEDLDPDGQTIMRYERRTEDLPQSRAEEIWEGKW